MKFKFPSSSLGSAMSPTTVHGAVLARARQCPAAPAIEVRLGAPSPAGDPRAVWTRTGNLLAVI